MEVKDAKLEIEFLKEAVAICVDHREYKLGLMIVAFIHKLDPTYELDVADGITDIFHMSTEFMEEQ